MSLLERISQRGAEREQRAQASGQAEAAEAAKPDAGESAVSARKDYSNALESGSDQNLQEEQPTPEEQATFTEMEKMLAEVVYGEKASGSIIESVMQSQDPVEGVGKTASDIVSRLSKKFPNASQEVLFGIGESAVEQVVDLIESTDPNLDLSDDQIAESFSIALSSWMENNPGGVSGDMMQYMNGAPPQQL